MDDKPDDAELERDVSREDIVAAFRTAMVSHFRSHIPGTNINEVTLLASDYLNHFHELVMLLEAVASDPDEFAEDLSGWEPITYEEHFTSSGFRDKNLAIAAYRRAPQDIRRAFDQAVARLHAEAGTLVESVEVELVNGDRASLTQLCFDGSMRLRDLIQAANAIAVGEAGEAPAENTDDAPGGQEAIDALFNKG
ncbi:hypothetical protein [Methyloligella solikamskensis]|uniref:Uncharacterized protein n=1 Tax=Methyloligella solikamskensis TaxID=1177756 RepID=A0ABW3JD93_9HYPH